MRLVVHEAAPAAAALVRIIVGKHPDHVDAVSRGGD
jgi:hypothetical protein